MTNTIYRKNAVKKIIVCFFAAIILLQISAKELYAGTAAKFLEFSPSVKAGAMGEAFVALEDVSAIAINPAGMAFLKYREISLTHAGLYQENTLDILTAVIPFKKKYALGVNFLGFRTPKEPIYDWYGNETGEDMEYSGSAFGIAGALKVTDNISLGINIKSAGEKLMGDKQDARIVDLGALVKYPLTKGILQFGAAVNTRGRLRDDENTPSIGRIGAAYIKDAFTVSAEFSAMPAADDEDNTNMKLGGEYRVADVFAPRIGFKGGNKETQSITGGFGIKWKGFYLDYAACSNGILGASQKVALGVKLSYQEEKAKKGRKRPGKATVVKKAAKIKRKQGETLKIAVADLDGKNVSAMDAAIVSDFIRTELVKTQAFTVLDRQNMERVLEEQSFQLAGCTTEECAVQMGKILNVSFIVVGTFSKFLETYYININFINVETGEILGAETAECASGRELPVAAQEIATTLAEQFGQ